MPAASEDGADDQPAAAGRGTGLAGRVAQYEEQGIVEPVFRALSEDQRAAAAAAAPSNEPSIGGAFWNNFLGHSPVWYKASIAFFLVLNVAVRFGFGKKVAAWVVLGEFIFSLGLSSFCYPLQSGGLIIIEAFALGLGTPETLTHEVEKNVNVLLLVAFMVACIHFLKNLLLLIFTNVLISVNSKVLLSVTVVLLSAFLSAFLDALSVAAVLVSVCTGILGVYFHVVANADLPMLDNLHHETMSFELVPHAPEPRREAKSESEVAKIMSAQAGASPSARTAAEPAAQASGKSETSDEKPSPNGKSQPLKRTPSVDEVAASPSIDAEQLALEYPLRADDIKQFQWFLRSLLMHGAVGTALGGCMTMVGEPQNIVIARVVGWNFGEFFWQMLPVSGLALPVGLVTCVGVEMTGVCTYGAAMPAHVRQVLTVFAQEEYGKIRNLEKAELAIQGLGALLLVFGLSFHVAEVGFIGLAVGCIVTAFNGITEEHEVADAFLEAMPFVSLLVVFFGVVAIIQDQEIFVPLFDAVLDMPSNAQPALVFIANVRARAPMTRLTS